MKKRRAELGAALLVIFACCGAAAADANPAHEGSAPQLGAGASAAIPVGAWESVDFVREVAQFQPGRKSRGGALFLKEFQCHEDGATSLGYTCQDGWVTHGNGTTKAQYSVKEMNGETYLFLPWLSGDVTERGMKPSFYVLRKISSDPTLGGKVQGRTSSVGGGKFGEIRPVKSVSAFDDVRWKDLRGLVLRDKPDVMGTLWFNRKTLWPQPQNLPQGFDPEALVVAAMNPGLGVRQLHRMGITGEGVRVAIIDQPLFQDHPEFAGKVAAYHDVGCGTDNSMHGPAVASLLVGEKCGTAPGAQVYYSAAPSWTKDAALQAQALDWIVEQNSALPEDAKIRVVSVSAAPSGQGSPFEKNNEQWDEACARAEDAGLLVLDCTGHHGVIGPCWLDAKDPENVSRCNPGFPGRPAYPTPERILVPTCPRTTAEEYEQGDCSYQYCGRGGLSWAIPYCAGVLAMGWQVRPDIDSRQMLGILFETARVHESGARIVNPPALVDALKKGKRPPGTHSVRH